MNSCLSQGVLIANIKLHFCFICSRGAQTILGEQASDEQELFLVDDCEHMQLDCVMDKVEVSFLSDYIFLAGAILTFLLKCLKET